MTIVRALLWIGTVLAIAVAGLLMYASTRPPTFRISRSAIINAPPDRIFAFINDFRLWGAWSPFDKLDPAMKKVVSGPPAGKGAVYEWDGNSKAGQGRMENVEAVAPTKVVIKLDFIKPFEAHNVAEFTLLPDGGSTRVTWTMGGPSPYMSKLVGIFMNIDKMVGNDFEAGLANLKALSEK